METKKYRVRLARPVFEVTVVEVEAGGPEEAVLEALCQADGVPESAWEGEFDPESYFYDVQFLQEVTADAEEDSLGRGLDEDRKYLLLRGDIDAGEGAVPFQPWLTDISDLMVADLCSDWGAQVATLERMGVAGFYASLEREMKEKNRGPGKVIPFRRPRRFDRDAGDDT